MPISQDKLQDILEKVFIDDEVLLVDMAGDENHYEVTITSLKFNNLSLIQQHKMVYDALGSYMGNELHALKINTKTK